MIEWMIFIWVIGCMFSIGAAIGIKDDMSFGVAVGVILTAVFVWPITLGVAWTSK